MRIGGIEAGGTKMVCAIGGSADRQRTAGRKSGHNHRACDDSHREAQDYPAAHGCVF